ncbi:MAG: MFS transporter [Phycisphaerales bacterium]|nr:MFS transporter [Phycisphaerales bacterium]
MSSAPDPGSIPSRPKLRAGVTIGAHFVVDVFSFVGIAVLPMLAVLLDIRPEQKALLLAMGAVFSGMIQPLVAWASDKLDTRALGTIGFVVAVLCIGNLGMARNFTELAILYSLGAMGVGAFHPPAAATVGQLGGARRSAYVAVFFLAGMVGGIVGNVFTPMYVGWMTPGAVEATLDTPMIPAGDARQGLLAVRWFIPIGLLGAFLLARAIHGSGHRHHGAHEHQNSWEPRERRGRWIAVWVMYASNVLRFTVNMALVYLFTEWASRSVLELNQAQELNEQLGIEASRINGMLQASMQIGMGAGGLTLGFILAARFEKLVFVVLPMLGALSITMIPSMSSFDGELARWSVMGAAVLSGIGFGAVIPVSLSLAQRLLPHRTSLVSGLMLGGAWALSFVGPIGAEIVQNGLSQKPSVPSFALKLVDALPSGLRDGLMNGYGLDTTFYCTAVVLAIAGLIAIFLPHRCILSSAN